MLCHFDFSCSLPGVISNSSYRSTNALSRISGTVSKLPYLVGNDCKTAAGLSCTGGFNSCIKSYQVGTFSNACNDGCDIADFFYIGF